ncbi:response regulator transcription factor [Marichromatium bheemlicum]|uniref:Response regulator transcription factor n=1 Tax=Marichromatium bheemlicum TaxID=365339 RepID=A0ABX1I480_9GAMM|nr:response regulator transcription factor [Marichromatium bheemlicum]
MAYLQVNDPVKRILIVDDHPLVRAGLASLIAAEPDLEVCGEAETLREGLRLVRELTPDLTIVDLSLEDGNGLELIKRLKVHDAEIRILVCSVHEEALFAERAISAGALGYINKHKGIDEVIAAVRQTLAGRIYLSADMQQRFVEGFAQKRAPAQSPVELLTDRELQVFILIGEGVSNARMAERLHLSVKTIETHREKIKRKLQLSSAAELVRYAVQWQLEQG